jgi:hypothetical protein
MLLALECRVVAGVGLELVLKRKMIEKYEIIYKLLFFL